MLHPLLIAFIFPSIFFLSPSAAARSFCNEIAVSQAGVTFLPRNDGFGISRAPFSIVYRGTGQYPSLPLSQIVTWGACVITNSSNTG